MEIVDYHDIRNKAGEYISTNIWGSDAQTAANYGYLITPHFAIDIMAVVEKHETAGSDGGAVTLNVVKVPNGSAISAGTSILGSTFNLKSTANTAVIKEGKDLSLSAGIRTIKPYQSLALVTSGTLTAVVGVSVTVYFKRSNYGSYR